MLWNYLLNHLELLEQLDNSTMEISVENWTDQLEENIQSCAENEEEEIDQLRTIQAHYYVFAWKCGNGRRSFLRTNQNSPDFTGGSYCASRFSFVTKMVNSTLWQGHEFHG